MKNPSPKKKIHIFEIFRSQSSLKIKLIKLIDLCFGSLICCLLRGREKGTPVENLEQILVIRPGGIGDAVFLLPIIKIIRKKWPTIEIDIICEKRNEEIFLSQPNMFRNVWAYDRLTQALKVYRYEYDVIIDSEQWHYGSAIMAYFINSQMKIGFASRPLRAKLFDSPTPYDEKIYELENFLNLFSHFIEKEERPKNINSCFAIESDSRWIKEQEFKDYVVLLVGASIEARRLTFVQSLTIIEYLLKKGLTVLLLGGKDVQNVGDQIMEEINDLRIINLVGRASLIDSAMYLQASKMVIGSDSGIIHLACAVGAPVVTFFGPGNKMNHKIILINNARSERMTSPGSSPLFLT